MSNPVDFFVHVPKTAGTTMQQIIDEQYSPEEILDFHRNPDGSIRERIEALGPEKKIFLGHIDASNRLYCPRPCRPFALLRDATERVVSYYYFVQRERSHPLHAAFHRGELNIEQIAQKQGAVQARFISGFHGRSDVSPDELLAAAKENLEHAFAAFGLTERFDESLVVFNNALGWKVTGYARANVARNRPTAEQIPTAHLRIIQDNNLIDAELYTFAKDLFERRLAAQPKAFGEQLSTIQRGKRIAEQVSNVRRKWDTLRRMLGFGK